MNQTIHIIGGGLAGSEAAWQAAKIGAPVRLYEMRTKERRTFAHRSDGLAELVCSNSFRNDDVNSAIGLLHEEMRRLDSLIMRMADTHKVPAGGALAMDREAFSKGVEAELLALPNIEIVREEITELLPKEWGQVILATGPLTSEPLAQSLLKVTGSDYLAFFDAIAPIVHKESIDFSKAWMQSRYDKGEGKDYINCPLSKDQYYAFIDALIEGDKTEFKDWEKDTPYFDGCLPIEVMAERGRETLSFGPMKPVGLTNPHQEEQPYAVVQLRQDNQLGTLWNMVGFQTKLKYGAQVEIFRTIPGLEQAEFARLGGIHRNTFIHSPSLLDSEMRLKAAPHIRVAGQVTGVEGYVESASMGLLAGRFAAADLQSSLRKREREYLMPPPTTAIGALLNHITGGHVSDDSDKTTFQPMNVNFGLFPPLAQRVKKKERKAAYAKRALEDLSAWLAQEKQAA